MKKVILISFGILIIQFTFCKEYFVDFYQTDVKFEVTSTQPKKFKGVENKDFKRRDLKRIHVSFKSDDSSNFCIVIVTDKMSQSIGGDTEVNSRLNNNQWNGEVFFDGKISQINITIHKKISSDSVIKPEDVSMTSLSINNKLKKIKKLTVEYHDISQNHNANVLEEPYKIIFINIE